MSEQRTIRITSINLNGIRAAHRRGFLDWLEEAAPDVLLMQEVRAEPEIAEDILGKQWESVIHPSRLKGRAGVGVAVRADSQKVAWASKEQPVFGLEGADEDHHSGRWIEAFLETPSGTPLRVVSAYFHAGEAGSPKQDAKMGHLRALSKRFQELLEQAHSSDAIDSVVAGDYNVVRGPLDLKNWKPNHNKRSGALDEEIAYLDGWVEQGWVDVVRSLAGPTPGPYSWWSWRGKAYDNDTGWRIDYHYATPKLGASARSFSIFRAPSWDTRFSDHAPVTVDYLF